MQHMTTAGPSTNRHPQQPSNDYSAAATLLTHQRRLDALLNPASPTSHEVPSSLPGAAVARRRRPLIACDGCGRPITDRWLLRAVDRSWHEACLRCSCCGCPLVGDGTMTLFSRADLLLCRSDYLRLFGRTGNCSVCRQQISAFELVMRANEQVYHPRCFSCQQCSRRLCVGDRFYVVDGHVICESDCEERVKQMTSFPASLPSPCYSTTPNSSTSFGCFAAEGHAACPDRDVLFPFPVSCSVASNFDSERRCSAQFQVASASATGAEYQPRSMERHLAEAAVELEPISGDDRSSGYGSPSPKSV